MALVTILSLGLALLNLVLHLGVCVFIVHHLRAAYWFPPWQRAWLAMLCMALAILPFRIGDAFAPPLAWRLIVACPMTFCFFYAMVLFRSIFRAFLTAEPLAPDARISRPPRAASSPPMPGP
jgi:hypothetical protein